MENFPAISLKIQLPAQLLEELDAQIYQQQPSIWSWLQSSEGRSWWKDNEAAARINSLEAERLVRQAWSAATGGNPVGRPRLVDQRIDSISRALEQRYSSSSASPPLVPPFAAAAQLVPIMIKLPPAIFKNLDAEARQLVEQRRPLTLTAWTIKTREGMLAVWEATHQRGLGVSEINARIKKAWVKATGGSQLGRPRLARYRSEIIAQALEQQYGLGSASAAPPPVPAKSANHLKVGR